MKKIFALVLLFPAAQAFALTAPNCQLAYKANSFQPTDVPVLSNVKQPVAVAGIPARKASTLFIADGVINTITASAEDDATGITKLTISVDLANGSLNEENTFFVNTFNDYRGAHVSSLILRPEGQIRFNFPQPVPVPGQPAQPAQPPAPLTFRGSTDWSATAIAALTGKVINQIEIDCSSDLH
jgi:hypothetical protein